MRGKDGKRRGSQADVKRRYGGSEESPQAAAPDAENRGSESGKECQLCAQRESRGTGRVVPREMVGVLADGGLTFWIHGDDPAAD